MRQLRRILDHATPADLPIEQATGFELVLDLKPQTRPAAGLPSLLIRLLLLLSWNRPVLALIMIFVVVSPKSTLLDRRELVVEEILDQRVACQPGRHRSQPSASSIGIVCDIKRAPADFIEIRNWWQKRISVITT